MWSLKQQGLGEAPIFSGCPNEPTGLVAFQVHSYFPVSPTTYTLLECLFITEETKGVSRNIGFTFWWNLAEELFFNGQLFTRNPVCLVTSLWPWERRMLSDQLWKISFLPSLLLEYKSQGFIIRGHKFSFRTCHRQAMQF